MDKYLPKKVCNAIRKVYPQFGYKKTDLYISSYPKSGRNWVHFLIANTLVQYSEIEENITFHNISEWIPLNYPKKPKVKNIKVPRIVAKHRKYDGQNTRVLYIMRNPVDVMVSYYFYLTGRHGKSIDSISQLIKSNQYGIREWVRHVKSWEGEWDILIRYEDLKSNTIGNLEEVLGIVGISESVTEDVLKKAVEESSFENMKKIEERWGLPEKHNKNSDFKFMKKGRTKKGKRKLSEEDYDYIKSVAGEVAQRYEYEIR
jgi:hypothetical protein